MHHYDDRLELAPRDIVARAIHQEMKKHQLDSVYLDISHIPQQDILRRFPTIYAKCQSFDIDISRQPIPVVPAAHYTCGGLKTDLSGRTNIQFLLAIGEATCTGLHGANRMASNSLLECLVFAANAGKAIQSDLLALARLSHRPQASPPSQPTRQTIDIHLERIQKDIRTLMWNSVGLCEIIMNY